MKTGITLTIIIIGFILTSLTLAGCNENPEIQNNSSKVQVTEKKSQAQLVADSVISKVSYIKDSRTNLCFAYLWTSGFADLHYVGGPALATCPCESIPPDLLTISGSGE